MHVFFLLMLLKKNMCFSHVKEHMSILYVDYIKFLTNRFVGNICPFK
jgi:hypothetical protein